MNYSGPHLITDAASEPITLNQAKLWLKIDTSPPTAHDDDSIVEALITAARKAVENEINRPIGEQTFEVGFECFESAFEFPMPPLISIVSIKYTLEDGTIGVIEDLEASPAVASTVDYDLETSRERGAIYLRSDQTWPTDTLANGYPVRIRYKAGYTSVPAPIIMAMRFLIGHLYENRELIVAGTSVVQIPMTLKYLCQPYRFEEFA